MNMVCMGNNTNCMDKVVQHMEKYMDINCMDNNLSMSNKDNCMLLLDNLIKHLMMKFDFFLILIQQVMLRFKQFLIFF